MPWACGPRPATRSTLTPWRLTTRCSAHPVNCSAPTGAVFRWDTPAVYLGIAEAAYNYIREHVTARTWTAGGGLIIDHPATQQTVGQMSLFIQSGRLLLVDAALDEPG